MSQPDLLVRLSAALEREGALGPRERVVVGVSGGPDSMALLHGLAELARAEQAGWRLHVAHLNHQLRGAEAESDAALASAAARELGLECTVGRVDLGGPAGPRPRWGLEESARRHRYEFLERVARQQGAKFVAVGHHADDNAETILHHLARGTGWRGLRGMLPRREMRPGSAIQLLRPLLSFRRAELVEFLHQRGVAYRRDQSNDSLDQTRNRIRHRVLPLLCEAINPRSVEALLRLGEQARWMEEFVGETARGLLATLTVAREEERLVLSRHGLLGRPRILQLEVLRQAASLFGLGERRLSFAHLKALGRLTDSERGRGVMQLPGGLRVERQSDKLVFSTLTGRTDSPPLPEVTVSVPGATALPGTEWVIETRVAPWAAGEWEGQWSGRADEEWMDYECVALPLVARGFHAGDRFHPLGAPGTKKLAEFFIDRKIPAAERVRTPILCDRQGPLWVIPHRIDERAKVTKKTRQLLQVVART